MNPATSSEREPEPTCSDLYGGLIAGQLAPAGRYWVLGVGDQHFAFSSLDSYLGALPIAWELGFVPEPRGSSLGAQLPRKVARLDAVDPCLKDYTPAELVQPRRRFSRR